MLDLFRRLKPLYGKRMDDLWIAYNTGDKERRAQIEELLLILAVRKQGLALGDERIVLEPPPTDLIGRGEYTIGTVEYAGLAPFPFRLSRNELLRHVFLLGPSGTGKSTLIISILRQLCQTGVHWWAVDFKRNYRCLLADPHGHSVVVFTLGRTVAPLSLNVLSPPIGVERNAWVEALSDIICTAYLLLHGARNVLKTALLGAISNKGDAATLRDALALVANELSRSRSGSRRYGWLESTHRSLEELSTGTLGVSLNAMNPLSLHELLGMPVVFELEGLGEDQQRFVSLFLLQSVLFLRKHETVQREVLRHVLVFDEAHNIFRKDQWGELSLPSKLAREVREYGEALVSATQQADVADSLIANSGTKIILRCDHPKDVDFTSKLLQVEPRWVSKIPIGHGIARLATRYYQSFLFTFPEQPLKNTLISDERVRERYTQWNQDLIAARIQEPELREAWNGLVDWARQPRGTALGAITSKHHIVVRAGDDTAVQRDANPSDTSVGQKEHALLLDILQHPISTVTERYTRLAWNPKTGNEVKNALLRNGLTNFEVVALARGSVKLLELTTAGQEVLVRAGHALPPSRRAGMEHEFWRHRIKERCTTRGCTVTEEFDLGEGKRADLSVRRGGKHFLIEIETGKSDIPANITKCQGKGATVILFFTTVHALERAVLPPEIVGLSPETLDMLHELIR